MSGEAASYYQGGPAPQEQQQYQQQPPPQQQQQQQQQYQPEKISAPPTQGGWGYDEAFKIEKPKFNDIWAGLLVSC
jgi:hypothetical protein